MTRRTWLFKSEPEAFSFDDLLARPHQTEGWDGVRNHQARNFLRDDVRAGDLVLFYHSSCDPPHVAGIAEVVRAAYPDPSAWDPRSPYFDPRSSPDAPRWVMVDVRALRRLERPVPLAELKADPELAAMRVVQRGTRLSIMPVTAEEFARVVARAAH